MTEAPVSRTAGWTAPGWEDVRSAFQANLDEGVEVGAAFAAYHRGRRVVDLWGGLADQRTGSPWVEDTLAPVFSSSKGPTAMCAHLLAQDGALDLGAPVSVYWPEFAEAGKAQVTVADLLAHRAGLPWIDGTMSLEEVLAWDPVVAALGHQTPIWPPGTAHGYHAVTFGWLVGEVVRRVAGCSLGTYLRQEITDPLGAAFHIGLPVELRPRVATLVPFVDSLSAGSAAELLGRMDLTGAQLGGGDPSGASGTAGEGNVAGAAGDPLPGGDLQALLGLLDKYLGPDGALTKALTAPGGALADLGVWNRPDVHAAEIPAANGIGDARSLAQLYSACVVDTETAGGDRRRVLGQAQLDRALEQQTEGPDRVLLGMDLQWGLGFMLPRGELALAGMGGPRSFGHFGAGGSVGWADPDTELALGYVMNRMTLGVSGDVRSARLAASAQACARRA